MELDKVLEKSTSYIFAISIVGVVMNLISSFLSSIVQPAALAKVDVSELKLKHLGSGNMKADGTEQIIFEFSRNEPFKLEGWISLENMENGDTLVVRQYEKLDVDDKYVMHAEDVYYDAQKEKLIRISPKIGMRGVKITIQQTSGSYKYYPWEFYMAVV